MKKLPASQRTEKGDPPRDYVVYYPSGNILVFKDSVFCAMIISGYGICNCFKAIDGSITVIDPRCVITRKEGWITEPRQYPNTQQEWVIDWLKEHPEWPPSDLVERD